MARVRPAHDGLVAHRRRREPECWALRQGICICDQILLMRISVPRLVQSCIKLVVGKARVGIDGAGFHSGDGEGARQWGGDGGDERQPSRLAL